MEPDFFMRAGSVVRGLGMSVLSRRSKILSLSLAMLRTTFAASC